MEMIRCDTEEVLSKMPNLSKLLLDKLGEGTYMIFAYYEANEIGFFVRYKREGLLIRPSRTPVSFHINVLNLLGHIEKDGMQLMPRIDGLADDFGIITSQAVSAEEGSLSYTLNVLPNCFDDCYSGMVSFYQYDEERDMSCEIRYDYCNNQEGATIYPGLLNRVNSVQFIRDVHKKGLRVTPGIVPKRMQFFGKKEIDFDTLDYSFVSFYENGFFNTLRNGSYNLMRDDYLVRYTRFNLMNLNKELIELPWPFCDYLKEEDIIKMIEGNGFRTHIPDLLIKVYNNEDEDLNLIQMLFQESEKHKTNDEMRLVMKLFDK